LDTFVRERPVFEILVGDYPERLMIRDLDHIVGNGDLNQLAVQLARERLDDVAEAAWVRAGGRQCRTAPDDVATGTFLAEKCPKALYPRCKVLSIFLDTPVLVIVSSKQGSPFLPFCLNLLKQK
jgi:hypothetical protein